MLKKLPSYLLSALACLTLIGYSQTLDQHPGRTSSRLLDALRIQSISVDPTTHALKVDLTNTSQKTITAFVIYGTNVYRDHPYTEDFIDSVGMDDPRYAPKSADGKQLPVGGIPPHESHSTYITGESLTSNLTIAAVVFSDATAVGSEGDISIVASRRKAAWDELSVWCESLPSVKSGRDAKALSDRIKASPRRSDINSYTKAVYAEKIRYGVASVLDQIANFPASEIPGYMGMLTRHCKLFPAQLNPKEVQQ